MGRGASSGGTSFEERDGPLNERWIDRRTTSIIIGSLLSYAFLASTAFSHA